MPTAGDFNRATQGEHGPNADVNAASGYSDAELDAGIPPVSDDGKGAGEVEQTQSQVQYEKFARANFTQPKR